MKILGMVPTGKPPTALTQGLSISESGKLLIRHRGEFRLGYVDMGNSYRNATATVSITCRDDACVKADDVAIGSLERKEIQDCGVCTMLYRPDCPARHENDVGVRENAHGRTLNSISLNQVCSNTRIPLSDIPSIIFDLKSFRLEPGSHQHRWDRVQERILRR
jgi:hypothetical protein